MMSPDAGVNRPGTAMYIDNGTDTVDTPTKDYQVDGGPWTIPAGETSTVFQTRIYNDRADEPDEEWFEVFISNPLGAELSTQDTVRITITDDDIPNLEVSDTTVEEGETLELTVWIKGFRSSASIPSVFEISVDYSTEDVTAEAGVHYVHTEGKLTFGYGERGKTITVFTIPDGTISDDRVFNVNLSNPVNAEIFLGTSQVRIIENDCVELIDPHPPSLTMASTGATEGDTMSFTVTLDKPFCDDVAQAVTFSTSLGTASSADVHHTQRRVGIQSRRDPGHLLRSLGHRRRPRRTRRDNHCHRDLALNHAENLQLPGHRHRHGHHQRRRTTNPTCVSSTPPATTRAGRWRSSSRSMRPAANRSHVDYATNTAGTATNRNRLHRSVGDAHL